MAANQHIHFSASLVDAAQVRATKTSQLFIDGGQSIANVLTALNAWAALLDAITGAQIVRLGVGLSTPVAGLKTAPDAGAENEETVTIDFAQAGLTTHYGDTIPAFKESLLTGDSPNLAAGAVSAYTALLAGTAVLGGNYSGLGNEALTAVYRGFQGSRKHRRQLFAKSVVYP
jgi:hypothetical protein